MEDKQTTPKENAPISALAKVVSLDTRLSRSEAMDLLMEDLLKDMRAEYAQLEREEKKAAQALACGLSMDDISSAVSRARPEIVVNEWECRRSDYVPHITIVMPIPSDCPKAQRLVSDYRTALKKRNDVRDKIAQMETSKTAFKNTVLRTMLAASPEGAAALDALAAVKLSIKESLVTPKQG